MTSFKESELILIRLILQEVRLRRPMLLGEVIEFDDHTLWCIQKIEHRWIFTFIPQYEFTSQATNLKHRKYKKWPQN